MRKHTVSMIAFVFYISTLAIVSYYVTPWVWLALVLGFDDDCHCDDCTEK